MDGGGSELNPLRRGREETDDWFDQFFAIGEKTRSLRRLLLLEAAAFPAASFSLPTGGWEDVRFVSGVTCWREVKSDEALMAQK